MLIGWANGLKLFDLPFALTGGGPANASETLAIRIYSNAFLSSELGCDRYERFGSHRP
ncbi:MAG: sugar ABC transporter permease [Paenibacillaceae bacterium]|nr:sugar ABC transporter permease [Paenibacillaceae bacterium]